MADTSTSTTSTTSTSTGADGKPTAPPPGTGTTTTTDDGLPADLGEGGKAAIRAERAARSAAERERDALRAEMDTLKKATQTDAERQLEEAKKAGAAEATQAANRRIVRSEIRAASAGKVADPEDAAALLGDLDRFIVRGEVDSKAITSAIDELVKAKPYLAPAGKAKPLPGGGATQSAGHSFTDEIRSRIRRG